MRAWLCLKAQPAQRTQQAQRVDPLEALPLRMALSNDALLDAHAAGPSSQEATDVHVSPSLRSLLKRENPFLLTGSH